MEIASNRPWKAGLDRHLKATPAGKFRTWNERAGAKALF